MIFSLILIYLILASFAVLSKLADATNQFPQFDQRQPDADKVHAVTRIKTRPHEWPSKNKQQHCVTKNARCG